jgi:hypothetical protein
MHLELLSKKQRELPSRAGRKSLLQKSEKKTDSSDKPQTIRTAFTG